MKQKLIIEGNAVYELDEQCMLRKRLDKEKEEKEKVKHEKEYKTGTGV